MTIYTVCEFYYYLIISYLKTKTEDSDSSPHLRPVIPLGLEPKTHALEGRCSNPAELRNHPILM